MKNEKFHITGMTCAACQANITRNVGKLDGVEEVNVSLLANQMTVAYDEEKTDEQAVSFGEEKKLDKYNNKQIKTAKKNK